MNLSIIGISGKKGNGKDTIGTHLIEKHGYVRVAFADSLKKGCQEIFGLSDEQVFGNDLKEVVDEYWGHTPREILQKIGTDLIRNNISKHLPNIGPDIWIRSVERQMKNLQEQGFNKFVITDVRFPNELEWIKKKNGRTIKVVRPVHNFPDYNESFSQHSSEIAIDGFICDHDVLNDSTIENLCGKVDNILN